MNTKDKTELDEVKLVKFTSNDKDKQLTEKQSH